MAKRKTKYPKDSKGRSILGYQHGILITKPWNQKMYDRNESIRSKMLHLINNAFNAGKWQTKLDIVLALVGHGYGYTPSISELTETFNLEISRVENHWLHSNTWPTLISKGIVTPFSILDPDDMLPNPGEFVGYDTDGLEPYTRTPKDPSKDPLKMTSKPKTPERWVVTDKLTE